MERMTVHSRVGADGVLHVSVPMGATEANRPVQVTIESAPEKPQGVADYAGWLETLSGRWEGDFTRGHEGSMEIREPLT